ncbi:PiggyBac transposable element-derived protein 4 [Plakobranchus ocellatus]|uniref:PiggyBac transposable element-derived protein 4 n=1 Tax=Plakobranchus ocellatus TaxID=259542 RepID=A0AAV3ZCH0_9GAST|nr:PiggyBac transposable element-derived protein 4 [Plakobranchus ocellatus]
MLDTSAIAAGVIFEMKYPDDPLSSTRTRAKFVRIVGKDLTRFQMLRRFPSLGQSFKAPERCNEGLFAGHGATCGGRTCDSTTTTATEAKKRGCCGLCYWKVNKKGTVKCHKCCNFLCKDLVAKSVAYCENCDA